LNVGWFHSPSKLDLFDRNTLLQIMPTKTEMSTDNSLNFECWMVCKSLILFPVQGNFKLHNPTCIVFACCKAFVQDLGGNEKIGDFFDILHTQVVWLLLHNDGRGLRVGEAGLAAGDRKLSRKQTSKAFDAPPAHGNAVHAPAMQPAPAASGEPTSLKSLHELRRRRHRDATDAGCQQAQRPLGL
jgi:hypothetical protein